MADAGAIRAGGAFVEIFAKDGAFQQGMTRVQNRLKQVGTAMKQVGTSMALGGAAFAAPMLLAVRGAAQFEDALLDAKTSAGLTVEQMEQVKQKSLELSKAGVGGPAEIAKAFTALIKAGMPLQQAMDGAAEAVVKFASNAGIEVAQAAELASDAMNVFGKNTTDATDIIKAAADSSSTGIGQMVEAFSNVGAVAADAGQSMETVSAALAILANNMVKGGDAGTALKTMLLRLTTGADSASEGLAQVGLSTESFRDSAGKLMPLNQMMDVLKGRLDSLNEGDRAKVMYKIFGSYGLKAATILMKDGSDGFRKIAEAMAQSQSNAGAFNDRMSGITGTFKKLSAALERLQSAFADSLGNSMSYVADAIVGVMDALSGLLRAVPMLGKVAAIGAGGIFVIGVAAIAAGVGLNIMAAGAGVLTTILAALLSPVGLVVAAVAGLAALFVVVGRQMSSSFKRETDAMTAAIMRGDLSSAGQLIMANLAIVFQKGWMTIKQTFNAAVDTISGIFSYMFDKAIEGLDKFMGLFGGDIMTLSGKLEKLGLLFKAAFDWKWASTSLRGALKDVDDRIAKERERNPTAEGRAAARDMARGNASTNRERMRAMQDDEDQRTLDELRRNRDEARKKALGEEEKAADQTSQTLKDFAASIKDGTANAGGHAQAEKAAGGSDPGGIISTFASSVAEQLGVGPTMGAQEQTAANTAEIADNTAAMASAMANAPAPEELAPGVAQAGRVASGGAAPGVGSSDMLTAMDKVLLELMKHTPLLSSINKNTANAGLAFG